MRYINDAGIKEIRKFLYDRTRFDDSLSAARRWAFDIECQVQDAGVSEIVVEPPMTWDNETVVLEVPPAGWSESEDDNVLNTRPAAFAFDGLRKTA